MNCFSFPSARPACDRRDYFSAPKGGKEQPYKAGRRNTLDGGELDGEIRSTAERKIFPDHPRRPDGIVRIVTAVEFCSKIIPGRLHG